MMNALSSEEQILAGVSDDWNRIVGTWVDGDMELNELYLTNYDAPIAVLGNMPVNMTTEYSYLGRVLCNETAKVKNCVKMKANTYINEEEGQRFIAAFFSKFNIPAPTDAKMQMQTEIELVTEASSLYPHHVTERKIVTMPSPQGQQQKIDSKEYRFHY